MPVDSRWSRGFRIFVYMGWVAFITAMVIIFLAEGDQNLAMSERDNALWLRPGGSVTQAKYVFPSSIVSNASRVTTDIYRTENITSPLSEFVCEPINDDDWVYTLSTDRILRGYNKFRNPTVPSYLDPPRRVDLSSKLATFSCSPLDDEGRASMTLLVPGTNEIGIVYSCKSKVVLVAVRFSSILNDLGDWDYHVRSHSFGNYGSNVIARVYSAAYYDGAILYNAGIKNVTSGETLHQLCSVEINMETLLSGGTMALNWCVTLSSDDRVYTWNFATSYKSGCVYISSIRNGTDLYFFEISMIDGSGKSSLFTNASFLDVSNSSYKGKLTLTKTDTMSERVLVSIGRYVAAFDQYQPPDTKMFSFRSGALAAYPISILAVSSIAYDGQHIYSLQRLYDGGFDTVSSEPTCKLSVCLLLDESLLPNYSLSVVGSGGSSCFDT